MLQHFHEIQKRCIKVVHDYYMEQIKRRNATGDLRNDPVYIGGLMRAPIEDVALDMVQRRARIGWEERAKHIDLFIDAAIFFKLIFEDNLDKYLVPEYTDPQTDDVLLRRSLKLIASAAREIKTALAPFAELSPEKQIMAKWNFAQDEGIRFYTGLHKLFGCSKTTPITLYVFGCDKTLTGFNHPSWTSSVGKNTIAPTLFGTIVITNMIRPIQLSVQSGAEITQAYVQIITSKCEEARDLELQNYAVEKRIAVLEKQAEAAKKQCAALDIKVKCLEQDKAELVEENASMQEELETVKQSTAPASVGDKGSDSADGRQAEMVAMRESIAKLTRQNEALAARLTTVEVRRMTQRYGHEQANLFHPTPALHGTVFSPLFARSLVGVLPGEDKQQEVERAPLLPKSFLGRKKPQ